MKKPILALAAFVMAFSFAVSSVYATPEKAKATGKACADCHGPKNSNGTDSGNTGNNKGPNVKK